MHFGTFAQVLNFILLENGCDITAYFMLDRTEILALLSGRRKIDIQIQKGAVEALVKMPYDITSVLKVG